MQKSKLRAAAVIVYAAIAILFTAFFIYLRFCENVSVREARTPYSCRVVEHYSMEEIEDPSAPIGVRREYRWTMDDIIANDTTLFFYLVHHYAEVYFDNELMYSLMPGNTNQIAKSISSNWVTVPLYPSDSGREIRVIVTPVYESVRSRGVSFQVGPLYSLYQTQLINDLPQLVLSAFCFLLGLFIMLVQLILIRLKKVKNWDIFFLGNFTMLLGIWKITDTRFSPLLFAGNTLVLGYLAIGSLFLASIPFALYLNHCFSDFKPTSMSVISLIASGAALAALFCQVFGIADFRQTLPLAHIVIILMILCMFLTVLGRKVQEKTAKPKSAETLSLLLIAGALADLSVFYFNKSSSGLIFTILSILIYTLSLFIINMLDTAKRAYTDAYTGLFNKARWDALMDSQSPISEPVCMIMLDLNGLKYINDTMGHEAGDKMIFSFANILRNTIPPTNTICRWGGDEFAVMLTNADRATTEKYLEGIRTTAEAYNASGEKPALHYAAGYALSTEFPELSRKALLKKADERMYLNKQQWYEQNSLQ